MKNRIKKIFATLGLLDPVRMVYHSLRSFSLHNFLNEYSYRWKGLPDGYPAPSARLVFLIIAVPWAAEYFDSGKEISGEIKTSLTKNNIDLRSFNAVLDFGCGCGRIIRHFASFSDTVHLYGSDYNPELIQWCAAHLPFAAFRTNTLAPPLRYENSMFDFLYARSVFTHLSVELQKQWMIEFSRILRSGGYLYFTTHGDSTFLNLSAAERIMLERDGILTVNRDSEGDNKCATYQTKKFVDETLLDGFTLVDYIPGGKNPNQKQDVFLVRKI